MRSFLLCFVFWAVFMSCVHAYNNENEEPDKRGNPPKSRLSNMYGFGLGKRPYSNYNFGLGKRADMDVLETDDLPFGDDSYEDTADYDIEKRSRFNFGLGKRYSNSKFNNKFNFGLGKRASAEQEDDIEKRSKYNFGLGKRDNNGLSIKSNGQEEAEEQERSSLLRTGGKHLPSAYAFLLKSYGPAKSSNFVGKRGKNSQNYPFLGKRLPVYDFGLGKRSSL